jgi:hypothetical protein
MRKEIPTEFYLTIPSTLCLCPRGSPVGSRISVSLKSLRYLLSSQQLKEVKKGDVCRKKNRLRFWVLTLTCMNEITLGLSFWIETNWVLLVTKIWLQNLKSTIEWQKWIWVTPICMVLLVVWAKIKRVQNYHRNGQFGF